MSESWEQRFLREHRAARRAIDEALSLESERGMRDALEAAARLPQAGGSFWVWGPRVATKNRALFRPLLLAHFSSYVLDEKGKPFDVWKGETMPVVVGAAG